MVITSALHRIGTDSQPGDHTELGMLFKVFIFMNGQWRTYFDEQISSKITENLWYLWSYWELIWCNYSQQNTVKCNYWFMTSIPASCQEVIISSKSLMHLEWNRILAFIPLDPCGMKYIPRNIIRKWHRQNKHIGNIPSLHHSQTDVQYGHNIRRNIMTRQAQRDHGPQTLSLTPGIHVTDDFFHQLSSKLHFTFSQTLIKWSLQNFACDTLAVLP